MADRNRSGAVAAVDAARARLAEVEARRLEALAAAKIGSKSSTDVGAALEGEWNQAREQLASARAALMSDDRRSAASDDPLTARLVDPGLPLMLLPLRLEARYVANSLLVRAFPDEIHVDSHEPALTLAEANSREVYLKLLVGNELQQMAAFRDLSRQVGTRRALYIDALAATAKPGLRPEKWARPPRAALMPDQLVAFVRRDGHADVTAHPFLAVVAEPLDVGPDPTTATNSSGALGDSGRWMIDFKAALEAGMAAEIDLGSRTGTVSELFVIGLRTSTQSATQIEAVANIFRAHDYTDGLSLLAPGTATNNLPGRRSSYTAGGPAPDAVFARALSYSGQPSHRRQPATRSFVGSTWAVDERTVGYELAEALGLQADTFGYVEGAGATWADAEKSISEVFVLAFADTARAALGPIVGPAVVDMVHELAPRHLSTSGPWPTLCIGAQPYGVLPVYVPRPGTNKQYDALTSLRVGIFEPAVQNLELATRAPPSGSDPAATLAAILQRSAVAVGIALRHVLGPPLSTIVARSLTPTEAAAVAASHATAQSALRAAGVTLPATVEQAVRLLTQATAGAALPFVEPEGAAGLEIAINYVRWLRSAPLTQVLARQFPEQNAPPRALFFEVMRIAAIEAVFGDARDTLLALGIAAEADFIAGGRYASLENCLSAVTPFGRLEDMLGSLSQRAPNEPANTRMRRERLDTVLARLQNTVLYGPRKVERTVLETLVASMLGAFSHRIDAWSTAVASKSLQDIRRGGAPAPKAGRTPLTDRDTGAVLGATIGGFGWLLDIPRHPQLSSMGFVHAPSSAQATTAGVLLAAAAAFRGTSVAGGYDIDLSSRHTRTALEIVDGVRSGLSLGTMLGYGIERALQANGGTAPALIEMLRRSCTSDARSADQPLDGLKIMARLYDTSRSAVDLAAVSQAFPSIDSAQTQALRSALETAADALDAIGDLTLAEVMHQTLNGTLDRSAAVADATSGTFVPPPRFEVVETPQRGIACRHRILALFDSTPASGGWGRTPRAVAAPLLDSFISRLLPAADKIAISARRQKGGGKIHVEQTTLAALLASVRNAPTAAALDLAAIDLVYLDGGLDALVSRIHALLCHTNPDLADAEIVYDAGAHPKDGSSKVSLGQLHFLAERLGRGLLPLEPISVDDLTPGARLADAGMSQRLAELLTDFGALRSELDAYNDRQSTPAQRTAVACRLQQYGLIGGTISRDAKIDTAAALTALAERKQSMTDAELPISRRLAAAFDGRLKVLASYTLAAGTLATAWAQELGASPASVRTFLGKAARVRERVAHFHAGLQLCQAATPGTVQYATMLCQTPSAPGERWIGLTERPSEGRTGRVAIVASGGAIADTSEVAGLVVDEWSDIVHETAASTAVAIHAEAPASAAPNVILLCIPDRGREGWDTAAVVANVREALALGQLRALGPGELASIGQLTPLLLAQNDIATSTATPESTFESLSRGRGPT